MQEFDFQVGSSGWTDRQILEFINVDIFRAGLTSYCVQVRNCLHAIEVFLILNESGN